MFTRARADEKGFTIVELVITIGICGILIPVLAAGLTNLALINNRARDLSLVNSLAQNKAELLRSAGFNSLSAGTTDFTSDLPSTISSPKSASYTVAVPEAGIKTVDIVISYKEVTGTRTVNYKTIISEVGVSQ